MKRLFSALENKLLVLPEKTKWLMSKEMNDHSWLQGRECSIRVGWGVAIR